MNAGAGVVDQDVHCAETFHAPLAGRSDGRAIPDVAQNDKALPTAVGQFADHLFGGGRIPTDHHNVGARLGEREGEGSA